jgi:glycosyltransferase involved in cell wall biosynthesis
LTRALLLGDWFTPAYKAGGPVRSLANLVATLGGEVDFSIAVSDRDAGDTVGFPGIEPGRWYQRDRCRVQYLRRGAPATQRALYRLLTRGEFDVVHVNGLFSGQFSIYPLLVLRARRDRPRVIVAPRGMLGDGALRIKPAKKQAFLAGARLLDLYRGVLWHATADSEADEIRRHFPAARVEVAPNLADPPPAEPAPRAKQTGAVKLCFFSRISPKKGLREAIDLLAAAPPGRIEFDVIGPVDDAAYWRDCQARLQRLNGGVTTRYVGTIEPAQVNRTLAGYHFLLLPTWNENFGHAIIEALAAGCPVIISDQTPWTALEAADAGWALPLARTDRWRQVLERCVGMDGGEFAQRSRAAVQFANQVHGDPAALARNRALFT